MFVIFRPGCLLMNVKACHTKEHVAVFTQWCDNTLFVLGFKTSLTVRIYYRIACDRRCRSCGHPEIKHLLKFYQWRRQNAEKLRTSKGDYCIACADPKRGGGAGVWTSHEKSQKYRVSYKFLSRFPEKLRSYRASIHCWVIISTPAKRHVNGVLLAGRWWTAYNGILILPPLINENNQKKKHTKKKKKTHTNVVRVGPTFLDTLMPWNLTNGLDRTLKKATHIKGRLL